MEKIVIKGVGRTLSTIGSIVVIGSLVTMILMDRIKEEAVFRHGKITNGQVLKFYKDYRGNGSVRFTYEVDGKGYERERAVNNFRPSKGYLLEGKVFPVKYNVVEPENAYMIVTPGDFKVNYLLFPDSLGWMREYVN